MEPITSARKRCAASRAAQVPGASAATRSASAASRDATADGIRGGFGGGVAWCEPPQPASRATLDAVSKPLRQRIRQASLADLVLGELDLVLDAAMVSAPGGEVEQEPGGPRVAVARLADRARVEQP